MANPTNKKPNLRSELFDDLSYLFSLNFLTNQFTNNQAFKTLINNSLLILIELNKKAKTNKVDIDSLITKYETLSQQSFDRNQNLTIKDKTEQVDYVNYLKTYCLNIFKLNLNKKDVNNNQNRPQVEVNIDNNPVNSNSGFINQNIDASTFVVNNQFSQHNVSELKERIKERLNNENQFLYDAKPKFYKGLKISFLVFNLLYFVALFAYAIIMLLLNNKQTGFSDDKGNSYYFFTAFRSLILMFYSFILCSTTVRVVFFLLNLKKENKKISDNFWYASNKFQTIFSIVINFFVIVYLLWPNNRWDHLFTEYLNQAGENTYIFVFLMVIFTYILLALISINIILLVVLYCFAPKFRNDLYQKMVMEEINKMNGTNQPSNVVYPTNSETINDPNNSSNLNSEEKQDQSKDEKSTNDELKN